MHSSRVSCILRISFAQLVPQWQCCPGTLCHESTLQSPVCPLLLAQQGHPSACASHSVVWEALYATSCSLLIPQKLRTNPNQKDTYKQLDSFLSTIGRRDCVVLMGDFNSRLARNTSNRVGKWCIHNRMDTGGKQLLKLMDKLTLRCVSSYFQPRRRHNNATYQNIQPEKAPSQIDYMY